MIPVEERNQQKPTTNKLKSVERKKERKKKKDKKERKKN